MRRSLAVGLALLAGGCGFHAPRPEHREEAARIRGTLPPLVRVAATVDIESAWLAGTFEAVAVARTGPRPEVRLQLFPDLGGKAVDLLVRSDRIVGYFPQTGEGIDWALPDEGRAHPLLFMGVTLLERFAPTTADRVQGVKDAEPRQFLLRPVVPGTRVVESSGVHLIRWSFGVEWAETGVPFESITIAAPGVRIRASVRDHQTPDRVDASVFTLTLPEGVRRR